MIDGYSDIPLPQKLGVQDGFRVALVEAPPGFSLELPRSASRSMGLPGKQPFHLILFFTTTRRKLESRFPTLLARLEPSGGLWIAWPKKASGVPTDLTEDVVRAVALAHGLVDNKVCAIDAVWSGLRLVVRVKDRPMPAVRAR
jgi:hypothetical protein